MNTLHRALLAGLLTSLSLSTAWADMYDQQPQPQYQQSSYQYPQPRERSYGEKIGKKALTGFTNVATFPLEIPKSMISVANSEDGNIIYGIVGGAIEGSINGFFRAVTGAADLLSFPIPTKAIVQPQYVWEDFYETRTMFGDVFRFDSDDREPVFRLPNGR